MKPRLVLALLAALVVALCSSPLPVLDEESYLAILAQYDPAQPYDWWRPWPPWNGENEGDAFVYAHPPLFLNWIWMWTKGMAIAPKMVWGLKVALALPWAALLGWSVGFLATRYTRRPWMAAIGWIAAPITILGLQRGLMPDLMLTSLSTLSVVAWMEATRRQERAPSTTWWVVGGLSLGCAVMTKYPAILLAPALVLHARAMRQLRNSFPFWLAFLAVILAVEAWLWALYGRPHLWEVLTRSGEIPRGPLGGRAMGTVVRLSMGMSAIFLLPHATKKGIVVLGGLTVALTAGGVGFEMPIYEVIPLMVLAGLGVAILAMLAMEAMLDNGDDHRIDLLLGSWGLFIALGIVLGHNFAAPRYLLPLMVPVAIVGTRVAERVIETRIIWWVAVALQTLLAVAVTVGEHGLAAGSDEVAKKLVEAHPEGGYFTGEWTFRWDILGSPMRLGSRHRFIHPPRSCRKDGG